MDSFLCVIAIATRSGWPTRRFSQSRSSVSSSVFFFFSAFFSGLKPLLQPIQESQSHHSHCRRPPSPAITFSPAHYFHLHELNSVNSSNRAPTVILFGIFPFLFCFQTDSFFFFFFLIMLHLFILLRNCLKFMRRWIAWIDSENIEFV